jgi:Sec-independent protein translocase protein TatA
VTSLAFLNLGASEIALVLLLMLLFFGVDKAPQMARALGRLRGELDRAKGQVEAALKTEDERAYDAQLEFERERERKIAEAQAEAHADEKGPEEGKPPV